MEVHREIRLPDFGYVGLAWVDCRKGEESVMLRQQVETEADWNVITFAIASHPQTSWQQRLRDWHRFGVRLAPLGQDPETQLFTVAHEIFDDIAKQANALLHLGDLKPDRRTIRRHRGRYPALQAL